MNQLKRNFYLVEITKIKRGNSHGCIKNAKPYFVLAIIDAISNGILEENKICYPNKDLEDIYMRICIMNEPHNKPTPILLPLLHLRSETFYDIKWKGIPFKSSPKAHSPSGKYLRDNFDYSFLDADLWALLQDPVFRSDIKKTIIAFYLKNK